MKKKYNLKAQFVDHEFYTLSEIMNLTGLSSVTLWRIRKRYGISGQQFGRDKVYIGRTVNEMMKAYMMGLLNKKDEELS
tara:strand:+ start:811 stop:1047 length:237 start_codon:yes stop_codon:yes gene_type:complete